jgi:hypothetical protein
VAGGKLFASMETTFKLADYQGRQYVVVREYDNLIIMKGYRGDQLGPQIRYLTPGEFKDAVFTVTSLPLSR